MIQRVWGVGFALDPAKVAAVEAVHKVLLKETTRMLDSIVRVGRKLNELATKLSPQEFDRGLRDGSEVFCGWSRSTLSKVMAVANFMDGKSLSIEAVPQTYSVLYEFTTLNDEEFERAKSLQLFRPDARRVEITDFKRRLNDPESQNAPEAINKMPEIVRIDESLRGLEVKAQSLRRKRAKIIAEALNLSCNPDPARRPSPLLRRGHL